LDQEIVDLISSDIDLDEDEEDEEEDSHYFSSKPAADVQAFHDRLQTLNSQPTQSRGKSSYSRGGSRKFSGKKWPKRGGAAGGSQRRGGGSGRRGGSSTGGNGASSSRAASGGGGSKRDGKIVKKSGGGIGLMPL
jgi:bloom syndrome protein